MAMLYGLPTFLQRGAVVALEQDLAEVEVMRATYQRRRDMAVTRLNQVPGLTCLSPDAGMFMMLDVRGTGLGSGEFSTKLYEATGVSVLDATAFGQSAAGHVRMSFVADDREFGRGLPPHLRVRPDAARRRRVKGTGMLTGINEYGRLRRVAMRRPADAMIDQKTMDREWRDLNYHTAPDFKRAVAEHAAFADTSPAWARRSSICRPTMR